MILYIMNMFHARVNLWSPNFLPRSVKFDALSVITCESICNCTDVNAITSTNTLPNVLGYNFFCPTDMN